jgi:hypothetical protein
MTGGPAGRGAAGGPAFTFSTDEAVQLATVAAATGDDRHAVTYRQADYWCRNGVLGPELARPTGSGTYRRWTAEDVLVLAAVARVADANASLSNGGNHRPGSVNLYREVAEEVRGGERVAISRRLSNHVTIEIEIDDITAVLAAAGVNVSP